MFYDRAYIKVTAGKGGNGCCSFRREKYVPRGGPNGGSGGNGGDVALKATNRLNTLVAFRYKKKFEAPKGQHGQGNDKHGSTGTDIILDVPTGTVVKEQIDKELVTIADLANDGDSIVIAHGGKGGLGNAQFATPHYQAPHFAELGEPGETKQIKLELKLIADVGLIGYPNVGKSTLISVISNAKPKIADYPFTTLVPNLGMARHGACDFVIADIPGLIKGAHEGKGLGHEFLRHVERTRVLVHLLDGSKINPSELKADFAAINQELKLFDEKIILKPQIVIVNKADTLAPTQLAAIQNHQPLSKAIAKVSAHPLRMISAVAHTGLDQLLDDITAVLATIPVEKQAEQAPKVFRPTEENERHFSIEKKQGVFHISGRRVERIAITTDLDNPEAVRWMHDRLQSLGVNAELEKLGIEPGDTVMINDISFEWD